MDVSVILITQDRESWIDKSSLYLTPVRRKRQSR
jgi:hypothetical protein